MESISWKKSGNQALMEYKAQGFGRILRVWGSRKEQWAWTIRVARDGAPVTLLRQGMAKTADQAKADCLAAYRIMAKDEPAVDAPLVNQARSEMRAASIDLHNVIVCLSRKLPRAAVDPLLANAIRRCQDAVTLLQGQLAGPGGSKTDAAPAKTERARPLTLVHFERALEGVSTRMMRERVERARFDTPGTVQEALRYDSLWLVALSEELARAVERS
jgi:hypothetical protein